MCKCQVAELSCMKEVCANWAAKILKTHPLWVWCRKNQCSNHEHLHCGLLMTYELWTIMIWLWLIMCEASEMVENVLVRNSALYTVKAEGWGSWELGSHELRSRSQQQATKAYRLQISYILKSHSFWFGNIWRMTFGAPSTSIVSRCCLQKLVAWPGVFDEHRGSFQTAAAFMCSRRINLLQWAFLIQSFRKKNQ